MSDTSNGSVGRLLISIQICGAADDFIHKIEIRRDVVICIFADTKEVVTTKGIRKDPADKSFVFFEVPQSNNVCQDVLGT
jgi:hypothetical protein